MIKELWNVALKVTDLDREVAFLRDVGASLVLRERVSMVGEVDVGLLSAYTKGPAG